MSISNKVSNESKWIGTLRLVAMTWVLISAATGAAEDSANTYSFSGPCGSQGSWTTAALAHTREVKQMITKLKDNPACNAMKARIEGSLEGIDKALAEIDKTHEASGGKSATLSNLPKEISALRAFSRDSSLFRNNVVQLLVGKVVAQSALSTQKVDGKELGPAEATTSVGALEYRTHRAASAGLSLFNSTMNAMQEAQAECLDDTNGAGATAGLVKILSSFASSGDDALSSQMANAVQNLGQYLGRNKKYVDALRKINDREFISSMSCLMEITADGYCSALDAQYMFREILNSQSLKVVESTNKRTGEIEKKIVGQNENFVKKLEKGPLAGYYILTRQVPVVTDWIQKVQYGITPQLPTEADFQIDISTNVYEHYNTLKKIEGTFNFQKKLMGELVDFKAKQTYVLEMLNSVANSMLPMGRMNGSSENFFSKVSTANELPFRLLGMAVPSDVLGTGPEAVQFTGFPDRYLQAKYRNLPLFSDPDKLADIIYENMQVLFKEATAISIAYYNKYFIVDKVQVVNDSLLGLDVNVRDALVNIDLYLANLEIRIRQDAKDPTMIASILDTRARIARILKRYRDLREYSVSLMQHAKTDGDYKKVNDVEMSKKLRQVGDLLLQQVYTEFEILTARTGFLSNRMASFVFQDYTLSLRNRDEFNQYFNELMLATGYNSLQTMMNMSQTEFSKIKTDLDSSMNIYKKNIDALEDVVKAGFVRNIFDLKLMASGKEMTEYERARAAMNMSQKMESAKIPNEESNGLQRNLRGTFLGVWKDMTSQDQELLGAPSPVDKILLPMKAFGNWIMGERGKIVISPVSEFDTADGEMAKLCTQTLAFANLRPYWELCKKAMLPSPLLNKNVTDAEVQKVLETYLSVQFERKAWEYMDPKEGKQDGKSLARNYQARICALRDYHRRNEVARMTSSMRDNGDIYENEFTREIKDEVKVLAPAPPLTNEALIPAPPLPHSRQKDTDKVKDSGK